MRPLAKGRGLLLFTVSVSLASVRWRPHALFTARKAPHNTCCRRSTNPDELLSSIPYSKLTR